MMHAEENIRKKRGTRKREKKEGEDREEGERGGGRERE